MAPREGLGLTNLVAALRGELEQVEREFTEQGKTPMFTVKEVEVEVHFLVEQAQSGGGGINLHFFAVEANTMCKSENVHRLKVSLTPRGELGFARPTN